MSRPHCVVVGAGVSGLTCAVRLLEAGWDVHVVAKERPEATVSLGAGAIWEFPPYSIEPQDKARRWALASLAVFEALQPAAAVTGVHSRRVHYLYRDAASAPAEPPAWARAVRDFRGDDVPPEAGVGFATGYSYLAPVVSMQPYLAWLERLVVSLGGTLALSTTLARLADAACGTPAPQLVVNCAALGAPALCGDAAAMTPVRGVLVLVRCPGVRHVYSDESWAGPALTYVVPKGGDVVACAGCAEPGAASCEVTPAEQAAVLERCAALLPALRGAPVLSTWAGLRPVRPAGVRLEREVNRGDGPFDVVHNYGHGGSGVVVSWGCAADVVRLAADTAAAARLPLRARRLPADAAAGLPSLQVACPRL